MATNAEGAPRRSRVFPILLAAALVYSFLAGLRTITDYDVFWQMATGRWIAVHDAIPSTDVLSYTASGHPWIYPVLSGLLFYIIFLAGGYTLLSVLGALACVGTTALLLRRASLASVALAIVALPRIAARTGPRAEMFTAILFACFLSLLWEYFTTGRARLWLLPALMVAWVNLHLGFVAGFALIAGYIACELFEICFAGERRMNARNRLARAGPWLALTLPASLVNPWGWNIYGALLRQNQAMAQHAQWINEWAAVPLNWNSWTDLVSIRDTKGVFLLMFAVAMVCAVLAVLEKQIGAALLIGAASYLGMQHVRLQALSVCVVIVVGGWVLSNGWTRWASTTLDLRMRQIVLGGAAALLLILAVARSMDLVTNRHYLGGTDTATFGTGLSWWFPEAAFAFVERNALPAEVFHSYNTGGFVTWRLGPKYRDYLDGRAIPFGPSIFEKQDRLMSISPDSAEWQREIDKHKLNTVVLSLARYDGAAGVLGNFCNSKLWAPVYLDEISAVFVHRSPDTRSFLDSHVLDCSTATILRSPSSNSALAFNQWANAALVLHVLGRQKEALSSSELALQIFPDSANLHFLRAKIFTTIRLPKPAEQEYRTVLALEPNDATWSSLAQLYQSMGDANRSFAAMQNAVDISPRPHLMLVNLGFLYLEAQQPEPALRALDEAVRRAPPEATTNSLFQLDLARGRASAWSALGNAQQAIAEEEAATRIAPERIDLWRELAGLYELNGRAADAAQARTKAEALQTGARDESK